MKLSEYIRRVGDNACAELWGVKPRTVGSWRRGERTPRREQAYRIVTTTRGAVDYSDIYGLPEQSAASVSYID